MYKKEVIMKMDIQRSEERGKADFGWLKANYSFSFANYYNPHKIHFGVLRVLNDDTVDAAAGFPPHPHDNMEIITIPLSGSLEHKDSMGNTGVITRGEVQVMSAGSGIFHSEFNHSSTEKLSLFQIWIMTAKKNAEPRYDQRKFNTEERKNKWQQVVNPMSENEGLQIHQDAWIFLGDFEKGKTVRHAIKKTGNGIYLLVIKGNITVNGQTLNTRDAAGITETSEIEISMNEDSELMVLDVPVGQ